MSLNENPIFLTQKRLVHRGGVLAAILIAAIVGLSLFSGLIAYAVNPGEFDIRSSQDAGRMFYAWTIGIEILVLIVGCFFRISQSLTNERKAGLWDSNRLTPLKPWQLAVGYWFGPPLREFYMGGVLALTGLLIVVLSGLSVTLWIGSQILIASTALFLGLIAVMVGLALEKPQNGAAILFLFVFLQLPSASMPRFLVTNVLLPTYGLVNLFVNSEGVDSNYSTIDWSYKPEIFGIHFYPILLTLILQFVVGIFLWRAVIRKILNPFQQLMPRWEAVNFFAIILFVQYGLIWGVWRGQFPPPNDNSENAQLLSIVQFITLVFAVVVLGAMSPHPNHIRLKAMRMPGKHLNFVISTSVVPLALILAGFASFILFSQFAFSITVSWKVYLVAVGNIFTFFLTFSLLLETFRLKFRRRALGFMALWIFILWILPFILAGVITTSEIADCSFLSPGIIALNPSEGSELNTLLRIIGFHFAITVLFFMVWYSEWLKLLAKASADQN